MKKLISVCAVLGLSACMGGGGDPEVTMAPDITSEITTLMSGARSDTLEPIFYNATVGRVAQDHAQDMVDRNYLSTFDQGTTTCAGLGGRCDMGDDLVAINRGWAEIVQMVAEGDKSVPVVFQEFGNRTIDNNVGEGDLGQKLNEALTVDFFEGYEFFGLGKAGSGADTKWAFVFVDPNDSWSDRAP